MATTQAEMKRYAVVRHVIYALVAAAVVLPFLTDLPLPFEASRVSRQLYEAVDRLKPGAHVLLAFDYGPGAEAELSPMSVALLRHCFKKDLIPIVMTHWPSGVGLAKTHCEGAAAEAGKMWGKEKLSGRDHVFLGFKPGFQNLVLNMGENLKGAFPQDYYGKPTQDMPALKGVTSLKDLNLVIDLASGASVEMWIAYGTDRAGLPFGAGTTAVMAPDLYPFLQSRQLVGFLGGLRGAAEYEKLLEKPADATRGMQAQSATHVLLIVLLLAANARYVVRRLRGKEGT